jgi:hypothetical protein
LNLGRFICLTFIFVSFKELCLFVSWCAVDGCGMACSDENYGRNRIPGAEDQGWSHRSGTKWPDDRKVGWRCVRLHRARGDEEHGFLGSASKPRSTVSHRFELQNRWRQFVSGLALKSLGRFVSGLTSKSPRRFSSVWP